jgi:hypothetical protein
VGRDGADVPADRPAIEKADFCVNSDEKVGRHDLEEG